MFAVVVPAVEDPRANAINVLREGRDGTIWAGTNNGLYRLDGATGRRSLQRVEIGIPKENAEQGFIQDLLEDASGSLWIAAPSGLYRRWSDGSAARYTRRDGLPHEWMQDLLEDHEGQLWAGTRLNGFFRFSADSTPRAPIVDLHFTYPDLLTSWVFQLFQTSDRRFWVATSRGLAEFFPTGDAQGRLFHLYTTRNGLSYHDITALNQDLAGNLWLGTNGVGAMKLALDGFSTFGEQDGVVSVNAIFEDRAGNVCFRGAVLGDARTSVFEGATLDLLRADEGTYHSRLGCFDGHRFHWFKPGAVTSFGWVQEHVTLQARTGEWWVGTGEGVYRFPAADHFAQLRTARPRAVYTMAHGLAAPQVFRLFEDSQGNVWVSTISAPTNGLALWERSSERVRDLAHSPGLPPLTDDLPRSFGEDASGQVWIGFNRGLARYAHGKFTWFTEREGVPPGAIMAIHVDRSGRVWLASARGGLVRVDNAGARRPAFVTYATAQGLSSNDAAVIAEDADGHLYVGGGRGLDHFNPVSGRVKHFTTADGLPLGVPVSAFRDRKGVLWVGMHGGLARLALPPEKTATPPEVLIRALRVAGVPQLVSALGERLMSLPDLPPNRNQLEIDFAGLRFGTGDMLRYQYRLEGVNDGWTVASEQRSVTYPSLPPGVYKFIVRAVNSDGIASAEPAVVAFTILRPLWLRWWFLCLSALLIGFSVNRLYRYRVARVLEMAHMRTRIATDLHDDIGANLTRIALLSEVAKREHAGRETRDAVNPPETSEDGQDDGPLASIAAIARESVSSMSDIVWAVNPARESLLDLIRRMRQHADQVFTSRDIELRFSAPGGTDNLRLAMDVRRDVLLIFKEAVNNAARHSGCSRAEIDLRVAGSRLVLTLADNGVGFDTSLQSDGQGLTSMQRRAGRLRGQLDITSANGSGTKVTLDIPL
jgi:ligand-binding sensor domain-containing protein/two-component sensor histidine kinase